MNLSFLLLCFETNLASEISSLIEIYCVMCVPRDIHDFLLFCLELYNE